MVDFIKKRLGNKILTAVTFGIVLVMGADNLLRLYFGTKDRIELIETMGTELAASTYSGIKYPMSVGDSEAVQEVLADVRIKMEGVEVFICDCTQQIIWSTHEEKIHTSLADTISNTEPLRALEETLHSGTVPSTTLKDEQEGKQYIITIQPILNDTDCFHCHGSSSKIVGGMVVRANIERALATVIAERNRSILIMLLGITTIIALCYALVEKIIHTPVKGLTQGVNKVASGDLDFEIQSNANDEIGELARAFNKMTRELKSAQDEINHWAGTLEELVEERTGQLKRAQQSALRSAKMASMGRLAAIVAHEINNPLAGIRTYAKLLLKKSNEVLPCTDSRYVEYLKTIESESARCGDIVRNLLQFARPAKPQFSRHDLNTIIRECLQLVRHKIELLNIDLQLTLPQTPMEVHCDGQKIKQALVALLLNGCDAVQQNTGVVEIQGSLLPEKNGVQISVQDNGVGMDEETKAHMFEPFFTTKVKTLDEASGINVGLGMSVVYEIIKSHQGEISISSSLGEGTTITLFLPAAPDLT